MCNVAREDCASVKEAFGKKELDVEDLKNFVNIQIIFQQAYIFIIHVYDCYIYAINTCLSDIDL